MVSPLLRWVTIFRRRISGDTPVTPVPEPEPELRRRPRLRVSSGYHVVREKTHFIIKAWLIQRRKHTMTIEAAALPVSAPPALEHKMQPALPGFSIERQRHIFEIIPEVRRRERFEMQIMALFMNPKDAVMSRKDLAGFLGKKHLIMSKMDLAVLLLD